MWLFSITKDEFLVKKFLCGIIKINKISDMKKNGLIFMSNLKYIFITK